MSNFNRLLLLLSNEVMIKSRDVVGPKVLSDPELVRICIIMYCLCVHVCVCMYVRMYVHTVCVYTHVCMYVRTYVHV